MIEFKKMLLLICLLLTAISFFTLSDEIKSLHSKEINIKEFIKNVFTSPFSIFTEIVWGIYVAWYFKDHST